MKRTRSRRPAPPATAGRDTQERADNVSRESVQDVTEATTAQTAVRLTQARNQALIDVSSQIVWTTDPSGAVVDDSPSWRAFTGQTLEQWQGFGWLDAIHPDDRARVRQLWLRAVDERTPVDTEYRLRHVSGDWRWTQVRAVPALSPDGTVREWVGMIADVSDRKRADEAQARLAAIVESSDNAIVSKDLNGIITTWNRGAERVFGYTAHEAVGQPVTLLIPPDRLHEETRIMERIRRGEMVDHSETIRRRKDGTLFHASVTVSPIRDSQGNVVGASKIALDITDRKRAEEKLRDSEQRFTRFMQHLPGLAWIKDAQGRYVYANDAAEKAFRTKRDALYGKTDHEVFPPATAALFAENDRQALANESSLQTIEALEHDDGIVHQSIVSKFSIRGSDGEALLVGGVAIDITELKQAEEELRESEERYRTLFDLGPVAVYSCDRAGVIQNFNRRAAELWGREPAVGDTDERFCGSFKLFRPDGSFMPHERCPMAEVVAGTISEARDAEVIIERPDGSRVAVIVNVLPLRNERGEVAGAINCFYDITARKDAEEGRARLSAIVESSDDAIISKDLNDIITSWNAGAERLFGYTAAEAVGQLLTLLIPPERVDEEPAMLARIRRGEVVEQDETVRRRKDDTMVDVSLKVSPILDRQKQVVGTSTIARDITERKKAAESLLKADRHKNEFLAMLAHELRNPLAPILVSIEICVEQRDWKGQRAWT